MSSASKHRVIATGFRAIAGSRADRWLAPLARGRGAILMFHHVRPARAGAFQPNRLLEVTPDHLERTLRLVGELGFDLAALDEVPERLARGGRPFVVLTFDDGYRDNRDHARPILRRHEAPWTMFVTADFASGRGSLWWLELEEAIGASDRVEHAGKVYPTRSTAEKEAAFARLYADLRRGPEPLLRSATAAFCAGAGIDRGALVRRLCLSWAELAELSASEPRLTIGAHTLSHPMLAKWDEEHARREILDGKAEIEAQLGCDVRHLAYPVGDPASAGPREFRLAAEAGYATAVTTRPGHLFGAHRSHLTALPRVSVNGLHQTEAAIRALLSGVPFLLWNGGRRLDVA